MPRFTIRPAVPDDWPVIADYNIRLAAETEDLQLDADTVGRGVQRLLASPERGRYFLACTDGSSSTEESTAAAAGTGGEVIAGQLMHTREWSDWRNGDIWWLQSVYVAAEFRRTGVFRALYEHLREAALQSPDVVGLRLYVEQHNTHALSTYAALGLEPAGYHVLEQIFPQP